ncbi:FAD-binding oxidoreductase [Craterilacuibacter sp. RT1T]|uniref:FAD-binding oxidoreductase n=1 Tax=Craterilacuibacter sp. RT1T TaxID=2942211 RepID=UPI0020BE4815|nr:FAD-binding oxidoreductase [Craterilacuibacter sp. RT1T]MCL6264303.1 FAD-binding oxidoreductase [Craterilacuibacter sp. RT1T]
MNDLISSLARIVGPAHVLTQDSDTAPYLTDWRGRYHGRCVAVVAPASTAEVAALVRLCAAHAIAIVPQGGNTSTCGAATPDASGRQLVLSLARMHGIRDIDSANNSITVEAGVTLAEVQAVAREAGRLFPLSLASEGSCQIGGNLSTNAGGLAVLRYGTMRELCLGLEVVLADGQILHALSGLRKDSSGLDVKQLFIGAEGQLGIITAATLKLFPLPDACATAWIGVDSADTAIRWLGALRQAFGDRLTSFELLSEPCQRLLDKHHAGRLPFIAPWALLIELSDAGDSAELGERLTAWLSTQEMVDGVIAQSEAERLKLWQLREDMSETQKKEGASIKHDIGVPSSAIAAFIASCGDALQAAFPGCRIMVFGHAGDGNLHYNVSYTRTDNAALFDDEAAVNAIVYDQVARYGGTLAAEHGVGQLKGQWLARYKDPVALLIMQNMKQALDPQGLMNPGKWLSLPSM